MISVSDKLFLGMLLDGKEFPLETVSFKNLKLTTSRNFMCPQGELIVADTHGYIKDNPFGDGQSVILLLGNDVSQMKEYQFRIFNVVKEPSARVNVYRLVLVYNAPRYLNENSTGAFRNVTSSEAIERIAENSLLDYSGDQTNDRMIWIPHGERRCLFANRICRHGYLDDTSYMQLGLTLDGELRYRNISEIDHAAFTYTFIDGLGFDSEDKQAIISKKELTVSGASNAFGGYKKLTLEQNPLKKESLSNFERYSSVKLKADTAALLLNKNIVERIEGSIVNYSPIDCGNTHLNYHKAVHQNSRLSAYYSSGMQVLIGKPSPVDLFDPVTTTAFEMIGGEPQLIENSGGNYFVTSKTINVDQAGVYAEKFTLLRAGMNSNNSPESQVS